jgi:hypothetical protein
MLDAATTIEEMMRVSGLLDEKEVTNAKKKECGPASQAHHDSSAHLMATLKEMTADDEDSDDSEVRATASRGRRQF